MKHLQLNFYFVIRNKEHVFGIERIAPRIVSAKSETVVSAARVPASARDMRRTSHAAFLLSASATSDAASSILGFFAFVIFVSLFFLAFRFVGGLGVDSLLAFFLVFLVLAFMTELGGSVGLGGGFAEGLAEGRAFTVFFAVFTQVGGFVGFFAGCAQVGGFVGFLAGLAQDGLGGGCFANLAHDGRYRLGLCVLVLGGES